MMHQMKLLDFLHQEYVYDLRSKLYEELEKYVAEKDRTELSKELNDTENWLYEEGDDCIKQVYLDRLDLLKVRYDYWFIVIVVLDGLDLLKVRCDCGIAATGLANNGG